MSKNTTKRSLLASVFALVLCVAMLVGSTFAWFTDTATTGVNKIQSGKLDVKLSYLTKDKEWKEVTKDTKLFKDGALWEPGHTEVAYLKVENVGKLALKYQLSVNVANEVAGKNASGQDINLSKYINMGVVESNTEISYDSRELARAAVTDAGNIATYTKTGSIAANDTNAQYVALVVYMPETVGNDANYVGETAPSIDLGVKLVATQYTEESDSFDDQYDKDATYPVTSAAELKNALKSGGVVRLNEDVTIAPEVADKTVSTLVPQTTVTKDTTMDLSGNKIGVDSTENFGKASPVLMAVMGGTLTINGDGEINCEAGNQQVYGINVNGGKVVINDGKYYGALTAVQVQKGSLEINGGFFDMAPTCKAQVPQYAKYVVNCIDAAYKNGTATISIKGGTFVNFDPSANPEGAGTSYVADGYKVVSEAHGSDTWYTVVSK